MTSMNEASHPDSPSDSVSAWLQRGTWWLIERLVGADTNQVLNSTAPPDGVERPDQDLLRSARQLESEFIDASGRRVDYSSLGESEAYADIKAAAASLREFSFEQLPDMQAQLAFWINLYNALIIDAIVSFGIQGKLRPWFFLRPAYRVAGLRFSADHIEHGVLRANRPHPLYRLPLFPPGDPRRQATLPRLDPRLHMALNCGARSCPPIAAYEPDRIDEQLDRASRSFVNGSGAKLDQQRSTLRLSSIFSWYQADFGGERGVRRFVARYLDDDDQAELVREGDLRIEYQAYDWSLNQWQ